MMLKRNDYRKVYILKILATSDNWCADMCKSNHLRKRVQHSISYNEDMTKLEIPYLSGQTTP